MLSFNYKLVKLEDDNLYVSIEPLMEDLLNSIKAMNDLDTDGLSEKDYELYLLKIKGLSTVHDFMRALLTEYNLKQLKEKHYANTTSQ